jgi:hypothetical protein
MRCYIFLLILVATIQGCTPDNSNQMPYIEASGYVDSMMPGSVVRWLSSNKVIYGVNATGKKNSYSGVNKVDLESSKQVNILDITTKKTSIYKKGQLLGYKNGKILIRLSMGGYDPRNNRQTSKPKYLYGNLGSETQEKYDQAEDKPFRYSPPLDKCPSDNTNGESYKAWLLSSEDGCLRIPEKYGKDRRWIYYQADGQALELPTPSGTFIPRFKWISWIGAYVIENRYPSVTPTEKVRVLYINGTFDLLDVNPAVIYAKPTRAGIIGAVNNNNWFRGGLRIFHDGSAHQITKGNTWGTEVSPDGCKVAYVTNNRLRVINVCSIF